MTEILRGIEFPKLTQKQENRRESRLLILSCLTNPEGMPGLIEQAFEELLEVESYANAIMVIGQSQGASQQEILSKLVEELCKFWGWQKDYAEAKVKAWLGKESAKVKD